MIGLVYLIYRTTAAIATTVLQDVGLITDNDTSLFVCCILIRRRSDICLGI